MNRWYAGAGDAGVMFVENAYVTLAGYEVPLPVTIALSARREVRAQTNEGLRDSIKQITPACTMDITLSGSAGNWRKATLPPIPTIPGVGGAVSSVAGVVGTLLGTSEYVLATDILAELFGILRKFENAVPITDRDGVLAAVGVTAVVPLSFDVTPGDREYAWSMALLWDLDEDPIAVLFPEEGEGG